MPPTTPNFIANLPILLAALPIPLVRSFIRLPSALLAFSKSLSLSASSLFILASIEAELPNLMLLSSRLSLNLPKDSTAPSNCEAISSAIHILYFSLSPIHILPKISFNFIPSLFFFSNSALENL